MATAGRDCHHAAARGVAPQIPLPRATLLEPPPPPGRWRGRHRCLRPDRSRSYRTRPWRREARRLRGAASRPGRAPDSTRARPHDARGAIGCATLLNLMLLIGRLSRRVLLRELALTGATLGGSLLVACQQAA